MRLLICEADKEDVTSALSYLPDPHGITLDINPHYLKPDPNDPDESLMIACGKPAVDMIQKSGLIPKKGGVEANRGKLYHNVQPEGWIKPFSVGVTYAPQIRFMDFGDWVKFETDINLYRRFENTGSMTAVLGNYQYVKDFSGVIEYCKRKHALTGEPVELSLDTETEGLDPFNPDKRIVCVQATACPGMTDIVYTKSLFSADLQPIIEQLDWLISQPWIRVIGANFKYDMLWLRVKWGLVVKNFAFDTCNGGSLIEENRPNTLNIHTKVYTPDLGGYDDEFERTHDKSKMGEVPPEDLLPYAGGDTDACLRNYYSIRKELLSDNVTQSGKPAKNSLASVYLNIVHPTLSALHKMEYTGVCVDTDKFHAFGADLENRMREAKAIATKHLPKVILDKHGGVDDEGHAPLSKPKMIADFLFSPQGLNLQPTITTEKTGAPSTSEHHLSQFKDHPEAGPLLEHYLDFKSTSKMHGTYYKGFLNHLRSDDRWHASYIIHKQGAGKNNEQDAAGTVTGRGSATAPAFQCVTGDTEILTPNGVYTASELIDPIIPDDARNPFAEHETTVHGYDGWVKTSNVFKSWRTDLLKITFQNGNHITCTPEHPILMRSDRKHEPIWVKAKDLLPGMVLAKPKPIERPDGPDAPPETFVALGIIAAQGYVSVVGNRVDIEVPETVGTLVHDGLKAMGITVSTEMVTDGGVTKSVTTYHVTNQTVSAARFTLWLPVPGEPIIPREIRGTKAWHHVLRGILYFRIHTRTGRGSEALKIEVNARSLARVILREALLDGWQHVKYTALKKCHRVTFNGRTAYDMSVACGLPVPPKEPKKNHHPSLSLNVETIQKVGAGYVYDFTVPDGHCFNANSMVVHNTVPKHSYWGKRLRECIVAPDGHVIVARDYSQGEVKVAACWAGETTMIEAYNNGIDLHVLTAATVNSMSYEEAMNLKTLDPAMFKALRQNGKAGNFGLLYGMGAYGFMMYADAVYGVKLTIEEAEAMRDAYFDLYNILPIWHDRQIIEVQQTGMVRSPLGRVRHLPNITSPIQARKSEAKRQAINSPIQGTLVDMMWWSMGIIERERPELLVPCGQIHDQGLWYVPEDDADEAIAYSGDVMENLPFEKAFGWKPQLKFNTDAELGFNLADLKEVA